MKVTAALPSDASAALSADQHISQTSPEVPPQPTVLVQASLSYVEAILNVKRKDTMTYFYNTISAFHGNTEPHQHRTDSCQVQHAAQRRDPVMDVEADVKWDNTVEQTASV